MAFLSRKNASLVGSVIVALSSASACATKEKEIIKTEQSSESNYIETHVDSNLSTESTITSTSNGIESIKESVPTQSTVETDPYFHPFLDMEPDEYNSMLMRYKDSCKCILGFDNPEALKFINKEYQNHTGDTSTISLSNVGYFQFDSRIQDFYSQYKFSEYIGSEGLPACEMMFIRAVLIEDNLRFGLDEIDWDYISSRFPRFTYNYITTNTFRDDTTKSSTSNKNNQQEYDTCTNPINLSDPCVYDICYFTSILDYNALRMGYMYNNPNGDSNSISDEIRQSRDKNSGRNVLDPSSEQAQQLMDDIHKIPGCENIDIFKVETREEYYACYGVYPEEVLDMALSWQDQFTCEEANKYIEESKEITESVVKTCKFRSDCTHFPLTAA